ncbi:hypothetical protein ABKN59_011224 [Abortiporus biennis]
MNTEPVVPTTCPSCNTSTPPTFIQELGSSICVECGTLSNPSQAILASHLENNDSGYNYEFALGSNRAGRALKGRNGWTFNGQGKEERERRNMIAMHEFISTLSSRLSSTGLAARAQTLFDQAMSKGKFRWGKKAKILAGACLSIALRESGKSDSLKDITYLLEEPYTSVTHSFTTAVSLLGLSLSLCDPSVHIFALQTYLLSVMKEASGANANMSVPNNLRAALLPLLPKIPTVIYQTAQSLSHLLAHTSHLGDHQTISYLTGLPTGPTSCAIYILSLESELGASCPQMGILAAILGKRLGVSKKVVCERYKLIYDFVEELVRDVPWLKGYEKGSHAKESNNGRSRAKVAKRTVVARGMKDVLTFQESIGKKRADEAGGKPQVVLEEDVDPNDGNGKVLPVGQENSDTSSLHPQKRISVPTRAHPRIKPKRQTGYQRSVNQASQFLLDPLSTPTSRSPSEEHELFTRLLAGTEMSVLTSANEPTRLQKLVECRIGGEEEIEDEELFDEDELEGFLRDDDEIQTLQQSGLLDWDVEEAEIKSGSKKRKRDANDEGGESGKKTQKRIDMDRLQRLLDPNNNLGEFELDENVESVDDYSFDFGLEFGTSFPVYDGPGHDDLTQDDRRVDASRSEDGVEVIEEWRPASPGGVGYDEDRYDL